MTAEQRPGRAQEEPKIVQTIDKKGRVGILPDNTWVVGWEQPNRRIAWHHHKDIFRVLRQNDRVILRFLGVPLKQEEQQEGVHDPSLGFTLTDLRDVLQIPGEVGWAQGIVTSISTIMTLSVDPRTSGQDIVSLLRDLRKRIGPVKNKYKVLGADELTEAAGANSSFQRHLITGKAFQTFIDREGECMKIVGSLIERGGVVLDWVDRQEEQIRRLKNAVGAVLSEIDTSKKGVRVISEAQRHLWTSRFFGSNNELDATFKIVGNPYAAVVNKNETRGLRRLQGAMETGDLETVEKGFRKAYIELDQVSKDREAREKSGVYDKYKTHTTR